MTTISASGVGGAVGTYATASVAMRMADIIRGKKKRKKSKIRKRR